MSVEKKSWEDHYWYTVPCMRERVEQIVSAVGSGRTVLEVGCNEGFVSQALKEAGNEVTSSDISDEMVTKAKQVFDIDVVKADVNSLPFRNKEFQVVVAGELLEHTRNPFKALTEIFRVASETVIVTIPIGEYWLGEKTHFWELGACFIGHDDVNVFHADKHILVLKWDRRRDDDLKDIPPFSTEKWTEKYRGNNK